MSHHVHVSKRAASQIRAGAAWWSENRTKASQLFGDEIERGFLLASQLPSAGQAVRHPTISGLRRLLLTRIRYYLYYAPSPATETVEILALWHASRGSEPELG